MEVTGYEASTETVKRRQIPKGPNIFTVPLQSYAYQPWSTRGSYLSQWFNYNFNPATWTAYASHQMSKTK